MPIRVLVVEPSPLALAHLQKMLAAESEIEIVGRARGGRDGLALAASLRPDVICLAAAPGGISGLEWTRAAMSLCPAPILVLRDAAQADMDETTAMLAAGAVESFTKPRLIPTPAASFAGELCAKVRRLSRVPVISRPLRAGAGAFVEALARDATQSSATRTGLGETAARKLHSAASRAQHLVAVGASTGGPQALLKIFSALPSDFAFPVLCVQHIGKGFVGELVEWLDAQSRVAIKIAEEGETPQPGTVHFPREDHHLELDARGRLHLSGEPAFDGHRPSVSKLFETVARACGDRAIGVLLTGMGSDGASGLKKIADAGGQTFAQDEGSCVVFGMPKQAIDLGAAQHILSPAEIARKLVTIAAKV